MGDYTGNAKNVFNMLFCGTISTVVYMIFTFAFPSAMVAIGAIYKDDCPAEHYIPIYLMVFGSFGILTGVMTTIFNVIKYCRGEDDDDDSDIKTPNPLSSFINLFLFAWFIAGNYWVYHINKVKQYDDPSDLDTYCHKTLYLFAFWIITVYYILLGITLLLFCIGTCVIGMM